MIAVFFDVLPRPGHDARYFEMAGGLKSVVDGSGGLTFIERFRSLDRPGWILSHQIWRDEASLQRWRANAEHGVAMRAGRSEHFADYKLRVADIIAESTSVPPSMDAGQGARLIFIACRAGVAFEAVAAERFESVYRAGQYATVVPVHDVSTGLALLRAAADAGVDSARLCRIQRDYGMTERGEAP